MSAFGDASSDLSQSGAIDLGALVNPAWLGGPTPDTGSDPAPLQPLSLLPPPAPPNPLTTTYTINDQGQMVAQSIGTDLNNIVGALTLQPVAGVPASAIAPAAVSSKAMWWVAAAAGGALVIALAASGKHR